jgi:hypothetical protein
MYTIDINFICERRSLLIIKEVLGNKNIQDWCKTNILSGSLDKEKASEAITSFYTSMGLNAPEIKFVSSPYAAIDFLAETLSPHPISISPESQFMQRWNRILKKQLNPEIFSQLNNTEIEEGLQQLVWQMEMEGFENELVISPTQDTDRIGRNLPTDVDTESKNFLNPRKLLSITDDDIHLHDITIDPTQKLLDHLPLNISIPISLDSLESKITANLGKDINPYLWKKIWEKINNYKKRSVQYPIFIFRPEFVFYVFLSIIVNYLQDRIVILNYDEPKDSTSESPNSIFELFIELVFQDISEQVDELQAAIQLYDLDRKNDLLSMANKQNNDAQIETLLKEKKYLLALPQFMNILQSCGWNLPFQESLKNIVQRINELHSGISEDIINVGEELLICQQLINLLQNCRWILPFEKLWIICDRPTSISFDEKGRLHALGKPAIEFADGNKVYFNNGVLASKKYEPPPIRPQKKSPVSQPPVSVAASSKSSLLTKDNDNLKKILIQSLSVADNCREIHAILLDVWEDFELVSIKTDLDAQPIHILKKISSSVNQIQSQRVPSNIKSAKQAVEWVSWE